jgi:hypothetical protein
MATFPKQIPLKYKAYSFLRAGRENSERSLKMLEKQKPLFRRAKTTSLQLTRIEVNFRQFAAYCSVGFQIATRR